MAAPSISLASRSRRALPWVGLAGLALLALALFLPRPRPVPPDEPEAPRSELQRVDGVLVWKNDTNRVFSGWMTEHYDDGTPKSRSRVVAGRLDGVSEGWNSKGVLQIREHFVAGVSEGLVTKWHHDGSKLSEGISKAGKFEGLFRRWHTNGVLAEELDLVEGQPHGRSRAWYPSGSLKAEVRLERGQVRENRHWKDGEQPALAIAQPQTPSP